MNQYWERKKLNIFWFSEWSWAAIYNWNSAKFQTFSMSNVPPNWTNSHSHNNFWITPAPGDQERWAAWMIFQWGVSWSSLALCHSFYKDTIDLWADQTPLPAKLISAVTLDIREHLWKFSLPIARGIAKASPHQSKLCVMPSCNLISIGHCWSDSLSPAPVLPRPPNSVKVQHNWEKLWLLSNHGQNKSSTHSRIIILVEKFSVD